VHKWSRGSFTDHLEEEPEEPAKTELAAPAEAQHEGSQTPKSGKKRRRDLSAFQTWIFLTRLRTLFLGTLTINVMWPFYVAV
jgi:hypothetical protein